MLKTAALCTLAIILSTTSVHARGGSGGTGRQGGGAGNSGGSPRFPGNVAAAAPAFSQPNVGAHPAISGAGTLRRPSANGIHPGFNNAATFHQGTFTQNNRNALAANRINDRTYAGNSLAVGNRTYNFANNSYHPSYYNHALYHGYWNGNRFFPGNSYAFAYGPYSFGRYGLGYGLGGYVPGYGLGSLNVGYGPGYGTAGYNGYYPVGWGLAGWGLGSLLYNSGYLGYSNPYYNGIGVGAVYNYSQPIPVAYDAAAADAEEAQAAVQSADDILNAAVAAFKRNDYDNALNIANDGIKKYPNDAVIHEFRALVLFAKSDYQQAAATIHSVLAVGPGWDWTTLSGLYPDISVYTAQLRSLEAAVRARPDDGAQRFLLAYHYFADGYTQDAAHQLEEVVKLVPNDRVAADLLRMVNAPKTLPTAPQSVRTPQPTPDPEVYPKTTEAAPNLTSTTVPPVATPIDPDVVVGIWNAARDDGSTFQLELRKDSTFVWTFTPKGQSPQSFDGTYSIQGNILSLEQKDGGAMVAAIVQKDNQHFNFRPVGAPLEDTGLNFAK